MSDVLTEMQDQTKQAMAQTDQAIDIAKRATKLLEGQVRESHAEPVPYVDTAPDPRAAELALLRHMALEGELSLRRDQLAAEHQAVTQRLAQARQERQALAEVVVAAGGKLPKWNL